MIKLEKKIYTTEKDFIEDMYRINGLGDSHNREKLINHEKDHFEIAMEKGENPEYKLSRLIVDLEFVGISLSTSLNFPHVKIKNKIKPENFKEICLAPKKPSFLDKFYASKIYQNLYSFYYNISEDFKK